MSSTAEAERKRRETLERLRNSRMKKQSPPPPGQLAFKRIPESPDSPVLVPASSSPVAPPSARAFANGFNSSAARPAAGGIPSSNLGRGAGAGPSGSPMAVMSAIHNRRTAEDVPRSGVSTSLSYGEVGSDSPSPAPAARSRDAFASGTPISPSPPAAGGASVTKRPAPSLIAAARDQLTTEEANFIGRLSAQFDRVPRKQVVEAVMRNRKDVDRAINEVQRLQNTLPSTASSSSSSFTLPGYRHPSTSTAVRPAGSASAAPARPQAQYPPQMPQRPPAAAAPPPPSPKVAKPKKNEKSAIYKKRGGKGRSQDDSESEAEMDAADLQDSEAESEMSWSGDEGGRRKKRRKVDDDVEVVDDEEDAESQALKAFNTAEAELITGTIACSAEQAATIIRLRPYEDSDDVRRKLNKARGVSAKLFEQYVEITEGFVQIDSCLNRCEAIAKDVASTLAVWRGAANGAAADDSVVGTPRSDGLNDVKVDVNKVSELLRGETDMKKRKILSSYIQKQPEALREGITLKDYQLLGVNWLNLLYSKRIGCILADEMGLGKTIQVIAFLAHLASRGVKGPHMIFVPASTLENWIREFDKFCPSIDVDPYYGTQGERAQLRDELKRKFRSGKLRVVLTSYTQVASHDDLSFFRKKIDFETCIYDEGHKLKNCNTKAYTDLLSIKPKWRLLLTGTPLQNNLQELVSLLMFIHKDTFTDAEPYLRSIFKSQNSQNLLSNQRTSRARTMLLPFVLRRRKAHVLDLPPKIEKVETCEMTKTQAKLYRETMQRGKKILEELDDDELEREAEADTEAVTTAKKPAKGSKAAPKKAAGQSSSNILMDLRKAASHPLLFRRKYTDAKVRRIARECLNTPRWCDSNLDYVVEDLEIMSDAEISHFCRESEFEELRKYALDTKDYLEGGKVAALERQIERCKKEGTRMLLFSQFVMILDILQVALDHLGVRYTRLDGGTKTDERQGLVDEFNDDPDITVFLLSTKAGGVGINLTAASVVVIYDQDFNPHNDRQAADRAYRIGQEKEVEVIKLITKDSIDEDMLAIGLTKLQLDDAVGGQETTLDGEGGKDDKTAKEMRKSLLTKLRNKFDAGGESAGSGADKALEGVAEEDEPEEESAGEGGGGGGKSQTGRTPVKKARGSIAAVKDEA